MFAFAGGMLFTLMLWVISNTRTESQVSKKADNHGSIFVDGRYLKVLPESDYILIKEKL